MISANASVTLARNVSVKSTVTARVLLDLSDGNGHDFRISTSDPSLDQSVSIRGLRPDRTYSVDVTIIDALGRQQSASNPLSITTDPLPDDFPNITVNVSDPAQMEPGYTLLDATRHNRSAGYIVIVDAAGEVVWYLPGDNFQSVTQYAPSESVLLRLLFGPQTIDKVDFDGTVLESWHAADSTDGTGTSVAVDGADFHHDLFLLPNGNILTSTRESLRQVDNFPIDENDPTVTATVTIREEPVIEFDATGEVVGKWDFLDMLKPTRIAFNGTLGQPNATDWVHLNGIWYDETDDTILASHRHQDAVVKFSRSTGELIWILGPHANWEGFEQFLLSPVGGGAFAWPYHQHAPMLTPMGTVLLFDNANFRASPFTSEIPLPAADNWSRAVEYAIDETNMTITQVWEYGLADLGEQIYTPFIGDADWMIETGNVLITFGGECFIGGVPTDNIRDCNTQSRIIETTYDTKTRVFDILVTDPDPTTTGYRVYRSERVPSLYPDGSATIQ